MRAIVGSRINNNNNNGGGGGVIISDINILWYWASTLTRITNKQEEEKKHILNICNIFALQWSKYAPVVYDEFQWLGFSVAETCTPLITMATEYSSATIGIISESETSNIQTNRWTDKPLTTPIFSMKNLGTRDEIPKPPLPVRPGATSYDCFPPEFDCPIEILTGSFRVNNPKYIKRPNYCMLIPLYIFYFTIKRWFSSHLHIYRINNWILFDNCSLEILTMFSFNAVLSLCIFMITVAA